jgi:hypothetical protein
VSAVVKTADVEAAKIEVVMAYTQREQLLTVTAAV